MTYPWPTLMPMGIVVISCVRPSVRPTIHGLGFVYCIQSAWKKWPIWHTDVSRWLTLSIHGYLWILLLVCLSVHLSVCTFTAFSGGCAFADKSLGTNGIKLDMLMYLLVLFPSANIDAKPFVCLFFFLFFFFFFLRLGLGQRRAVVIIGRWLLPSLVDTGDICCHYWLHILVYT